MGTGEKQNHYVLSVHHLTSDIQNGRNESAASDGSLRKFHLKEVLSFC